MNNDMIHIVKPDASVQKPKKRGLHPVLVVGMTLTLAIVSAVSGMLLYKNRKVAVAPTAPQISQAATTVNVSDDFAIGSLNTNKWEVINTVGATVSQTGGQLIVAVPHLTTAGNARIKFKDHLTGDFTAEADLVGVETNGSFGESALVFQADSESFAHNAAVRRRKDSTSDRITHNTVDFVNLPANTGTVRVKITRIGRIMQTFYKVGADYKLLFTYDPLTPPPDGYLILETSVGGAEFPASVAKFDNFSASINISNAPTPIPGTDAACVVSFDVLALAPTPTVPGPPGLTPTPTPTSPPGDPNNCNGTCGSNSNCEGGLFCYFVAPGKGYCRNPDNPTSESCQGGESQPTPTPTVKPGGGTTPRATPTPTPVALEEAGTVTGTWMVLGIGTILLILGAVAVLAI